MPNPCLVIFFVKAKSGWWSNIKQSILLISLLSFSFLSIRVRETLPLFFKPLVKYSPTNPLAPIIAIFFLSFILISNNFLNCGDFNSFKYMDNFFCSIATIVRIGASVYFRSKVFIKKGFFYSLNDLLFIMIYIDYIISPLPKLLSTPDIYSWKV